MGKEDELKKAFSDGQDFEKHFSHWKFQAVVGDDELESMGTIVNNKRLAISKVEIRNELRAELRESWKIAQFKGKLSPRLKNLLKSTKAGPPPTEENTA